MANWSILVFYGFWATPPFTGLLWPQAISCSHWPLWPIVHLTKPQANSFVLGLRVPSCHHQGPWSHPFDYGVLGHLDPLWPLPSVVCKPHTIGPPEPNLAPNLISPTNGQKDPRTQIGLWQSPEATRSSSARFPLHSTESLLFTNVLCSMDSAVVHIWYNIALCTNFSQQSNGDGFRTKLGHFKLSSQIHPWRLPEDHLRTPTTCPYRSWFLLSFRILPREISRGYEALNQLSRYQVLQYSLENSIVPYMLYSIKVYGIDPFGQFIFHCGNSVTQVNFQDYQICIDPKQSIRPGINPPGSVFSFFTYTGHLFFPRDLFPS
ncbi:hypothetical protein O181_101683 [Austropuccinia psidii MF-1]|uniref:Uncharacterized protein n=1 Tax=Austropuccinia psidii MF-1 TaxID=1389203 RepID=A0A9Q3JEX8_9BASI|nr:hypothetical protein [Austropuccinia psidii MF-1]